MPQRDRVHFLLLNIGHFLDHMFTLIFATVAALALAVTPIVGKSCGKQRIQYVPATTTAWSSTMSYALCDDVPSESDTVSVPVLKSASFRRVQSRYGWVPTTVIAVRLITRIG